MKKIITFFLIISLFSISSEAIGVIKDTAVDFIQDARKTSYTYLVLGVDAAAGNTDVIMLFSYNGETNSYSILGVPRDTYFAPSSYPHKINGYIPSSTQGRNMDLSDVTAFSHILSDSLGIEIDGTALYTMSAVEGIVDAIGGVEVNIPTDISGKLEDGSTVHLKAGKRSLNGKEAVFFIRHRGSYLLGDLGRMDAQKLFVSAFINKLKSGFNLEVAIKLLTYRDEGIITDINTGELISFALKNITKIKDASGKFATLPGKAVSSSNGVSYYSVNKLASEKLLRYMDFRISSAFDKSCFFRSNDEMLYTVYSDSGVEYKIYDDEDLINVSPK